MRKIIISIVFNKDGFREEYILRLNFEKFYIIYLYIQFEQDGNLRWQHVATRIEIYIISYITKKRNIETVYSHLQALSEFTCPH